MKNILSAFFILFVFFHVNGQTYTEKKADSILNSIPIKDTNYAKIAHDISFYFYKEKKDYHLGIKYGKIEINTLEQNEIKNDSVYANALYNVGKFHYKLKDYQNAITYYSKVLKTKDFPLRKAQAYCALGKCYRITGDLYKSFDYYLKGIPLMKKYAPLKNFVSLSIAFSLVCKEIDSKKSNNIGIVFLNKIDSILKLKPELKTPIKYYSLNVNLANLYASKKSYNYNKAKYYYLKNLNKATLENNKLIMANSYLNLGELYLNKENDSCLYLLKKSTQFKVKQKSITSEGYRNLANYYTSKENYDLALKNINESLNISFNTKNNNIIPQLSDESLLKVLEKRNVSRALKSKVEILIHLYKETKDSNYLEEAIETVNIADNLITTTINFSTENNTLFLWRQVVSDIYTLGVRVSYLLNSNSLMFSFIEKNKAFLLATEISSNLKNLKLPLEITSRDLTFKKNILKLESNKTNNQIKDSLFNLK
ncbi:tetratricopeptide repeat protein, partial [Tenacibaculum sp. Cn5-34]